MKWIIFTVSIVNIYLLVISMINIPRNNYLKKYFIGFSVVTNLWIIFNFLLRISFTFLLFKITYAAGAVVLLSALLLIENFTLQTGTLLKKTVVISGIGALFSVLCLIDSVFFSYTDGRIGYTSYFIFYLLYFFVSILYLLICLIRSVRLFKGIRRLQARWILLGVLGFGLFGFTVSFLLPLFGINEFSQLDSCGSLFFVIATAYAIMRYHILDINIIIKRNTIYGIMVFFVTAVFLVTTFISEELLQQYLGYTSAVLTRIITAVIISITFLPIRNAIEGRIDALFFRKKIDISESINRMNKKLITVLDLRKLLIILVEGIKEIIKAGYIVLFLHDKKRKLYLSKAYTGFDQNVRHAAIDENNPIVQMLRAEKSMLKKVDYLYNELNSNRLIEQMNKYKAEIVLPLNMQNKMIGFIILGGREHDAFYTYDELQYIEILANEAAIAISNAVSYSNLKDTYFGTIEAFAAAIEAKDKYTRGHSERVAMLSTMLAVRMNLHREFIEQLKYAAILHDIGKIGIHNTVLNKRSSLTEKERLMIQQHPGIGVNIISTIKFLEDIKPAILHHHEKWDGTGYPDGLKAYDIPILARIIAVADAFDAMTSDRSYRNAMNTEKAVHIIIKERGFQFCPTVVDALVAIYDDDKLRCFVMSAKEHKN
jgi:putative nucleotidyltransferase with HDIG domain